MSIFPKVQGPCPYKSDLSKYMEGDLCRMCDRRVVNLNPLSDTERVALISGCKERICVSYSLRPAVAAALTIAAIGAPMSAAAQEAFVEAEIVGAILDPNAVEYISKDVDDTAPAMPVIYDDEDEAPALDEAASIPTNETSNPQTSNK